MKRVGIIGTGLQFRRRAPVVAQSKGAVLSAVASLQLEHAEAAARPYGCRAFATWQEVVALDDLDIVVVCTPPHLHAEISIAAMRAGKDVLCEKPLTRTLEEALRLAATVGETGRIFKCGFNHRYHPAIQEAHRLMTRGEIGRPTFARCRYGICGRPGYEQEWRADPRQAAGGQFIEQGTHAIDLFRWFLGEITEVSCMSGIQYFRDQELDDNGMAMFRTAGGAMASLHTSLTQWKNQFSFEVFGEDGYLIVEGLGSSYGTERLVFGKRDFESPFNDHMTEYRGGDRSWDAEWNAFMTAVQDRRSPAGNEQDGLAAMRIGLTAYEAEKCKSVLPIVF
jgi:predicted dehydrogenase